MNKTTGGTDTFEEVTAGVSFPIVTVLPPSSSWTGSKTFSATLQPTARLLPGDVFRVRVTVERQSAGGWTLLGTFTQSAGGTVWHFASTNSTDVSPNVNVRLTTAALNSQHIIRSVAGQGFFRCVIGGKARRYDAFLAASPGSANVTIPLRWTLRDLSGNLDVPLVATAGVAAATLADFAEATPRTPVETLFTANVDVVPQNWADIDPLRAYELRVEAGHPGDAVFTLDSTRNTMPANWLALTGTLRFANFVTTFDQLTGDPLATLGGTTDPAAHAAGTLNIPTGHGLLPGHAGHTFGGALPLKVMLNGDLQFTGATPVAVTGPASDTAVVNGIPVKRSGLTLGTAGASAGTFEVQFPLGMSYAAQAGTRRLKSKWLASGVALPLNADLVVQPWVLTSSPLYVVLERLPLVFQVPSITVNFQTGKFTFSPSLCLYESFFELGTLEAYALGDPAAVPPVPPLIDWPTNQLLHAGNDQVFRLARTVSGDGFTIGTGADGAATIDYLRLTFQPGAYFTHFPRGVAVAAFAPDVGAAQFVMRFDQVDNTSTLTGVALSSLTWNPNQPSEPDKIACNSAVPVSTLSRAMTPVGNVLNFRPDGSLAASVNFTGGGIAWGVAKNSPLTYTHVLGGFTNGTLFLPAHSLPWRDPANLAQSDPAQAGLAPTNRTAALHLAGRSAVGALTWEAPQTAAYQTGALEYAGLNLRATGAGGPFVGVSVLGGVATPSYPLRAESKFYVRPGGVSGALQSDQDFTLSVYGMAMNLQGVKLAFLGNGVRDSLLNGGLRVGGPELTKAADFTLTFTGLRLFGDGSLDRGTLAPNQGAKLLRHWKTSVTPLSMEFKQPNPCDASIGFLALGVEAVLPALATDEVLRGVLGFRGGDGSLIARGDADNDFAVTGLDSRLCVPGNLKVRGPGTSQFSLTPVTGAYLSKWPGSGAATGFASVAGALDVPFFENLTVHLHADPPAGGVGAPAVYLMQPPDALGPFTLAGFDPRNEGTPGVAVPFYRLGSAYFPHAHKNWLGLLDFDFPLEWNPSLRQLQMRAGTEVSQNLVVAQVKSRVRSLTPTTADLKFKATLGPDLPSVSATDLLGGALNGLGASAVLDAISGPLPGFTAAISQLQQFEEALADTPEALVRSPLLAAIAFVRAQSPNATATQFRDALAARLAAEFSGVSATTPKPVPTRWKETVFAKLDLADQVAVTLRDFVVNADTVLVIANAAAGQLGVTNSSAVPNEVKEMLNKSYGLLSLVHSGIGQLKTGINALDLGLDAPAWTAILDQALPMLPAQPLAEQTDAQLADTLLLFFLGDAKAGLLGEAMRVHLSEPRDQLRAALDEALGGVNEMLQGAAGDVFPPVGPPGLPDLSDLQFGKIDGHARINGDSLHELRLDADITIKTGTDFNLHGYVLFRDLTSDTPASACRVAAGVAAELTLGASTMIPLGTPVPPATTVVPSKIEIEAKFAFADTGALNGLAGRLGLSNPEGALFGIIKVQQAELGFGFGGGDAYLYGKGAGQTDFYDLEAALFFGRTCDLLAVMTRVDAQAAELLNDARFDTVLRPTLPVGSPAPLPVYGFYGFGYGAISVNALIGIPPSCMLNLKAGAGLGAFYFYRENNLPGHPANQNYHTVLGLRNDLGVSGELLCVADISARLSLIGAAVRSGESALNLPAQLADATGISGNGVATVEVTIGLSPFEVTLSKSLNMSFGYKPLKFELDF